MLDVIPTLRQVGTDVGLGGTEGVDVLVTVLAGVDGGGGGGGGSMESEGPITPALEGAPETPTGLLPRKFVCGVSEENRLGDRILGGPTDGLLVVEVVPLVVDEPKDEVDEDEDGEAQLGAAGIPPGLGNPRIIDDH